MDRQTLRDGVHRYNADGIAGLADRQREGRPPALNAAQMQALRELVMSGPLPSQDGVVRWRCIDLRDQIAKRYEVEVHTRTVGKLLRRLGMRRLQPRPYHPKKDADAQEAFKKNFADLVAGVLPPEAADKPIEIWFQDEARVGQQDTLSYIWPRADRVRRGCVTTAMILSGCSVPSVPIVPSVLPHHARRQQRSHGRPSRRDQHAGRAWRHAVLICDGAGWHQHSTRMPLPANISLLRLPSYAPELNPIEHVWAYLRANQLSMRLWDTYDDIVGTCRDAWNSLMANPARIQTITQRKWATVKT